MQIIEIGLDDTLESGESLTIGLDYRKEKLNNINKYFEIKLASVLRNSEEKFIPKTTTLNKKIQIYLGRFQIIFRKFKFRI